MATSALHYQSQMGRVAVRGRGFVLGAVILFACKAPRDGRDGSVQSIRSAKANDSRPLRCSADADCHGDALCACSNVKCSITPDFYPQAGDPDGLCVGRLTRLVVRLPVRADGGWVLEGGPHKLFATEREALEDPWRVERDDRLEDEIELLKARRARTESGDSSR